MKGLILTYLESHDYVKRKELLTHLHGLGVRCSDRAMRNEISMMVEDGYLIASSAKGYKLGFQESDYKDAVSYLKKKAFSLLKRAGILEKGFEARFKKQLELEL